MDVTEQEFDFNGLNAAYVKTPDTSFVPWLASDQSIASENLSMRRLQPTCTSMLLRVCLTWTSFFCGSHNIAASYSNPAVGYQVLWESISGQDTVLRYQDTILCRSRFLSCINVGCTIHSSIVRRWQVHITAVGVRPWEDNWSFPQSGG